MSETEKATFWLNVSAYYGRQLPDPVLKMYVYDVKDTPLGELRRAFEIYRSGPQAAFFPLPAVLKNIINPPVDELSEANETAGKVYEAVRKFGHMESQKARAFMGELAWSCVESFGGWYNFCSNDNLGQESTIRAQIRDMAKSKLIRAQQGRSELAPGEGVQGLIGDRVSAALDTVESDGKLQTLVSDALKGKTLESGREGLE